MYGQGQSNIFDDKTPRTIQMPKSREMVKKQAYLIHRRNIIMPFNAALLRTTNNIKKFS